LLCLLRNYVITVLSVFLYLGTGAFIPVYAMETYGEDKLTPDMTNFDARQNQMVRSLY
jgi:hypothetical protein